MVACPLLILSVRRHKNQLWFAAGYPAFRPPFLNSNLPCPANLYQSLVSLRARLLELNRLDPHEWALNGCHEARILRNAIIHSDGVWRQRAIDDFMQVFPSRTPPAINSATKVNIDDLFAYRRAMRTVLNAAARS